jgi:hypothetical protein
MSSTGSQRWRLVDPERSDWFVMEIIGNQHLPIAAT